MSWDNDSGKEPQPASSSKQWAELTDAEKTAVVALGYSQLSWDYPWPAAAEKYFADLSAAEQAAAVELGFDATTWDNESGNEPRPVAWRTAFADLSEKEKNAARALGYTKLTWDNDPPALPASASKTFAGLATTCGEIAPALHTLAMLSRLLSRLRSRTVGSLLCVAFTVPG